MFRTAWLSVLLIGNLACKLTRQPEVTERWSPAYDHVLPPSEKLTKYRAVTDRLAAAEPPPLKSFDNDISKYQSALPNWIYTAGPDNQVAAAKQELIDAGIDAFPALIAAANDPRYSYTHLFSTIINMTVGDTCQEILAEQLTGRRTYLRSRPTPTGYFFQPTYLYECRKKQTLLRWWLERESKTLPALQIEALTWLIAQEEAAGFVNDAQRQEVLGPLRMRLLKATKKARHDESAP